MNKPIPPKGKIANDNCYEGQLVFMVGLTAILAVIARIITI